MKNKKLIALSLLAICSIAFTSCTGPKGEQGEPGINGKDGENGKNGNDGAPGKDGEDGKDGKNGSTWLNGSGEPSLSLGQDDDYYIDNETQNYYQKQNGTWILLGSFKGEKGEPGKNGSNGSSGSNGLDGNNGNDGKTAYSSTILPSNNGMIIPSIGSGVIGTSITFTFTWDENYYFDSFTLDGSSWTNVSNNTNNVLNTFSSGDKKATLTTTIKEGGFIVGAKYLKVEEVTPDASNPVNISNDSDGKDIVIKGNEGTTLAKSVNVSASNANITLSNVKAETSSQDEKIEVSGTNTTLNIDESSSLSGYTISVPENADNTTINIDSENVSNVILDIKADNVTLNIKGKAKFESINVTGSDFTLLGEAINEEEVQSLSIKTFNEVVTFEDKEEETNLYNIEVSEDSTISSDNISLKNVEFKKKLTLSTADFSISTPNVESLTYKKEDKLINLTLGKGTSQLKHRKDVNQGTNKITVNIDGNKESILKVYEDDTHEGGHIVYERGITFNFKNITIEGNTCDFDGIVTSDGITFSNCIINKRITLYGGKVEFNSCTFEYDYNKDDYCFWTWGAEIVNVNDCTFNTSGKAIKLYGNNKTTLNITNSTFNTNYASKNNITPDKAVVEIGRESYYNNTEYILNVVDSTAIGFANGSKGGKDSTSKEDLNTYWFSDPYFNRNSSKKVLVNLDGIEFYKTGE